MKTVVDFLIQSIDASNLLHYLLLVHAQLRHLLSLTLRSLLHVSDVTNVLLQGAELFPIVSPILIAKGWSVSISSVRFFLSKIDFFCLPV